MVVNKVAASDYCKQSLPIRFGTIKLQFIDPRTSIHVSETECTHFELIFRQCNKEEGLTILLNMIKFGGGGDELHTKVFI